MHRNLFALAAILAMMSTAFEAGAACTAGNPNANVAESTPTSAFTDNHDGTVTHSLTGLMWKQCAEGQSTTTTACDTGTATGMTWAQALGAAKNSNFAGHNDWRLPNKKELESIVENCGYNPSINRTLFPATPASSFWSGSSYASRPLSAWVVYFNVGGSSAYFKPDSYYVRLVRGGQSFDSFDSASTITVTSSANPSTVGNSVTLTARVDNTSATGTVAFKDNGTGITGCAAQTVTAGVATCATGALTQGSHTIIAVYSGDSNYGTSTSANFTQTVNAAAFLNDTGQDTCYDDTATLAPCTAANSGDAATYPRQDGRFGRDAKTGLIKTGAGAKGFDFTKVCFNGDLEGSGNCTGTLVANTTAAATASPATDWACTKDNVTNLIWSLESGFGNWTTYATATLPTATNNAAHCGHTGWRLPTRRELLSIVHNGTSSLAIDSAYFPGTQSNLYWSADTYAPDPANGWSVVFSNGSANSGSKTVTNYVRLVHDEQVSNTYIVTYDANGGSGGLLADSNNYLAGATVTTLGRGTLNKGSMDFTGWNTQADGIGTNLAPASTFTMGSSNVTLYANWTPTCPINMNYSIRLGVCQCDYLYVIQHGYCQLCPAGWTYTNGACTCVKSKTNSCSQ